MTGGILEGKEALREINLQGYFMFPHHFLNENIGNSAHQN
jgi:hypothetical protein